VKSKIASGNDAGLAYWLRQVPRQAAKAAEGLSNDDVHDLRVALRRCRSMAAGFRAIDPDTNWKKMRREATELFDSVGELRDCQVTMEWVEQLGPRERPLTQAVAAYLRGQETGLKEQAAAAIRDFDVSEWQRWTRILPERVAHLPPGSEAFRALAVDQLNTARRMQAPALKTLGPAQFHRLRIELKKFRYIVENFLPREHELWEKGLKTVQDLLGEIHDLDVLRETVVKVASQLAPEPADPWLEIIRYERNVRVDRYRESMSGKNSLWVLWRSGLPRGRAARQASIERLQAWSSFLDSDLQHSRRVARFAVRIHDGLSRLGLLQVNPADRELLRAASIVHEVGRAAGPRNHHKATEKLVSGLDRLAGWKRNEVMLMARIARYHRGALPGISRLSDVPATEWRRIRILAGILRLANALDAGHDGSVRSLAVKKRDGFITIHATGLQRDSDSAERIAAARYLLEDTCGLPFLVEPAAATKQSPR
jgi:CHAD domain-containing protein